MYNMYTEEKKLLEWNKKKKDLKHNLRYEERHREKTNHLALNYQKRIKKFMVDVSKINYYTFIILDGRRKPPYRNKSRL